MKIKHAIIPLMMFPLLITNCKEEKKETEITSEPIKISETTAVEDMVKRGDYLIKTIGCTDCHTPKKMTDHGPEPDMDRFLMGHPSDEPLPAINKDEIAPGKWLLFNSSLTAAVGPWGVSFAANLTPDETGLGNWTFENFKVAMRQGKFKGMENGRPLLPPMPWPNFAQLTDDDLQAMFEYLKTIKPINNIVPNPIPPNEI